MPWVLQVAVVVWLLCGRAGDVVVTAVVCLCGHCSLSQYVLTSVVWSHIAVVAVVIVGESAVTVVVRLWPLLCACCRYSDSFTTAWGRGQRLGRVTLSHLMAPGCAQANRKEQAEKSSLGCWWCPCMAMQATYPELGEVQALETLKGLLCTPPPLFPRTPSCAETSASPKIDLASTHCPEVVKQAQPDSVDSSQAKIKQTSVGGDRRKARSHLRSE